MSASSSSSETTLLPFPPTPAQLYARALWDPKPTTSIKTQKLLAYALGYPMDWRVERFVEKDKSDPTKHVIRDRIHAVVVKKKNEIQCTWFHHDAAQRAALQLEAEDGDGTLEGSHLLPPIPKYDKGDIIQVRYDDKWWDATIIKRKQSGDEFLYSVKYHEEDATSDDVEEDEIRPGQDPGELAAELGFTTEWKATKKGSRYVCTAPNREKFKTKKAALKHFKEQTEKKVKEEEENDVDDPPWRTEGHEWLGRQVISGTLHRISGTRKVHIDQIGTIDGYIDEKDVDKEGNPGFVSEKTGKPAKLFHVSFPDEPHHQYASFLLESKDLEEHEIADNLLEESLTKKRKQQQAAESSQKKKRARR